MAEPGAEVEIDEFEDLEDLIGGEDGDIIDLSDMEIKDPENPFWRLDRRELLVVLKVIADISQRNADAISKSVLLYPKDGYVYLAVTNKDIYYRSRIKIKNEENVLDEHIILTSKQLIDVTRYSAEVVLYKEGDRVHAVLMGGTHSLDVHAFSKDLYDLEEKPGKYKKIQAEGLKIDMERFLKLLALATAAEDKRVLIMGGSAYGSFLSILSRIDTELPDMVVKASDARDLSNILNTRIEELGVSVKKGRVYYRGAHFTYSSILMTGEVTDEMQQVWEKIDADAGILVDGNYMYNLYSFLSLETADSANSVLEFGEEGLHLKYKNKMGRHSHFEISSAAVEKDTANLQIGLSKKIFTILKDYPTVSLEKIEEGIAYSVDDMRILQGIRGK